MMYLQPSALSRHLPSAHLMVGWVPTPLATRQETVADLPEVIFTPAPEGRL